MSRLRSLQRLSRVVGFLCLTAGIVLPIVWIAAVIVTDPEFSMSDAEAVYDYVVSHTTLTADQTKILNDGVIYAHGNSSVVSFLPWLFPIILLISAFQHLTVGFRGGEKDEAASKSSDSE